MKVRVTILVALILIVSCSRRACGGLSGKRCVNLELKNENNFIKNKLIV